jgi:hypothetical protein
MKKGCFCLFKDNRVSGDLTIGGPLLTSTLLSLQLPSLHITLCQVLVMMSLGWQAIKITECIKGRLEGKGTLAW